MLATTFSSLVTVFLPAVQNTWLPAVQRLFGL